MNKFPVNSMYFIWYSFVENQGVSGELFIHRRYAKEKLYPALVCGVGGLGLIIMSNLNLSWVKLMLGWVVTILESLDENPCVRMENIPGNSIHTVQYQV